MCIDQPFSMNVCWPCVGPKMDVFKCGSARIDGLSLPADSYI